MLVCTPPPSVPNHRSIRNRASLSSVRSVVHLLTCTLACCRASSPSPRRLTLLLVLLVPHSNPPSVVEPRTLDWRACVHILRTALLILALCCSSRHNCPFRSKSEKFPCEDSIGIGGNEAHFLPLSHRSSPNPKAAASWWCNQSSAVCKL